MTTAFVLLIGNELLSGKVHDRNGALAIESLRPLGIDVLGLEIVPDTHARIVQAIRRIRAELAPSIVLTSGGIGPTHDDVTIGALAEALQRPLVRHEALAARIREHYGSRTNDDVLTMADLPEGVVLDFGDSFFPLIAVDNVYALPGDPGYFQRKLTQLVSKLESDHPRFFTHTLTLHAEEAAVAAILRRIQAEAPSVTIGSYPRLDAGRWITLVTLDSRDPQAIDDVNRMLHSELPPGSIATEERQ